jgi:hypothetical protein
MIQSSLPVANAMVDPANLSGLVTANVDSPEVGATPQDFAALLQLQANFPAKGQELPTFGAETLPPGSTTVEQALTSADGKTLPLPAKAVADLPVRIGAVAAPAPEGKETEERDPVQPDGTKTKEGEDNSSAPVIAQAIATALLLPDVAAPPLAAHVSDARPALPSGIVPIEPADYGQRKASQSRGTELTAATLPADPPKATEGRSAGTPRHVTVPVQAVTFIAPESAATESIRPEPVAPATAQLAPPAISATPSPASHVAARTDAKPDRRVETGTDPAPTTPDGQQPALDPAMAAEHASDRPILAADLGAGVARSAPAMAPSHAASPSTAPHDFAALVDRLVEARQALAPAAVTAAVAHSDFGRVTLNFRSEGDSLAVSMASADPAFAPAVQAAAQSFGMGANLSDNAAGSQPRNDQSSGSSGQQSVTSQGSGQPQGQAQGQAGDQGSNHRAPQSGMPPEPSAASGRERLGRQDETSDIYA